MSSPQNILYSYSDDELSERMKMMQSRINSLNQKRSSALLSSSADDLNMIDKQLRITNLLVNYDKQLMGSQ
jgi:hypothetical protein